ncbi:DUF6153 family protein [Streptomyces sp. NRRL F-4474]|uniref:DUF6153 family protein n=1 Tax=Streptomyces sp. NRRL F-4474 TaxID=1463851 RepID=UPI0004C6ED7C|nr:DUF6153 family protein [Streptomyces sp. NRRL F-4474]
MTRTCRPTNRRPSAPGAALAVLVLAVLTGILGMHALGPAPASAAVSAGAHHAAAGDHAAPTAEQTPPAAEQAGGDCSHPAGGSGHAEHADATCAAAGVASAYSPPALAEALLGFPGASSWEPAEPVAAAGARAPPDLAELQLLRI